MKRINFLKRIVVGGASLLVAKHTRANAAKQVANIYLNSVCVVGFQYYGRQEVELNLVVNETSNREVQKTHDSFCG